MYRAQGMSWVKGSVCFVLKYCILFPFRPSGVQISKQNLRGTFNPINNFAPVRSLPAWLALAANLSASRSKLHAPPVRALPPCSLSTKIDPSFLPSLAPPVLLLVPGKAAVVVRRQRRP